MIRIDIPFQIGPSGQTRFEKKTPNMRPSSINLVLEDDVLVSDFWKLFIDRTENRSWIKKVFYFIPWIRSRYDFIRTEPHIYIFKNEFLWLKIPLKLIPIDSNYNYGILGSPCEEYLISLEWDKNPSVSKPISGTLIVMGEEC